MASDSSGKDLAENLQEAFSKTKSIKSKFKKFGKKLSRRGNGAGNDIPSFPPAGAAADAGADAEVVRKAEREDRIQPIPDGVLEIPSPECLIGSSIVMYGKTPAMWEQRTIGRHTGKKCRECGKKIATHGEYCEDHQTLADARDD